MKLFLPTNKIFFEIIQKRTGEYICFKGLCKLFILRMSLEISIHGIPKILKKKKRRVQVLHLSPIEKTAFSSSTCARKTYIENLN